MKLRLLFVALLLAGAQFCGAQTASTNDAIARIKDEGMNRSKVMETILYLTEVIGPRLTASPGLRRANDWTKDRLAGWGLENAHLEAWGPFGYGWSLKRFSAEITEPLAIPLQAFPAAWSPGWDHPVNGHVIYLDATNEVDLVKYTGKLKGMVVLWGRTRQPAIHFEPEGRRYTDTNLLKMANAPVPSNNRSRTNALGGRGGRAAGTTNAPSRRVTNLNVTNSPASVAAVTNPPSATTNVAPRAVRLNSGPLIAFLLKEKALLLMRPSFNGDGGTLFLAEGTAPTALPGVTNAPPGKSLWMTNAPTTIPQIIVGNEQFNRMVRMLQAGEKLKMDVNLQVRKHTEDVMAYNTVAELPGTDLKDQVVMLGAHMDSWHSGTGATDNGAGVASVMEALRIIKASGLQPRRTIRVALWTGEEQGLHGSKAYVASHFGYYTNVAESPAAAMEALKARTRKPTPLNNAPQTTNTVRRLITTPDYEKLSAYFNLDNGTGKVRGMYMQGNEDSRPLFSKWLRLLNDDDAATLSPSNTGGTDHLSFDEIGLPGFQFIQDPIEYFSRTHHSTADVYDRIIESDLKQASVALAIFAYQAAMMEERFPRKPTPDR